MKKLKISRLALLFSMLAPIVGHADTILEQISAANNAFAKAILTKDIDYLVDDYTEDACIIAPSTPKICGKAPIRKFWETVIASNPKHVDIVTLVAQAEANMAYATGELLITDAEATLHKNRFVLIFKRVNEAWKLHIDSWTPQ